MKEKFEKLGTIGELLRRKLIASDNYAVIPMIRKDTEIYFYNYNDGICFDKIPNVIFPFDLFDAIVKEANRLGGKMYCADSPARNGEKLGSTNLPLTVIDAFVAKNFFNKQEGDSILGCATYIASVLRWIGVAEYEKDAFGRHILIKSSFQNI